MKQLLSNPKLLPYVIAPIGLMSAMLILTKRSQIEVVIVVGLFVVLFLAKKILIK